MSLKARFVRAVRDRLYLPDAHRPLRRLPAAAVRPSDLRGINPGVLGYSLVFRDLRAVTARLQEHLPDLLDLGKDPTPDQ